MLSHDGPYGDFRNKKEGYQFAFIGELLAGADDEEIRSAAADISNFTDLPDWQNSRVRALVEDGATLPLEAPSKSTQKFTLNLRVSSFSSGSYNKFVFYRRIYSEDGDCPPCVGIWRNEQIGFLLVAGIPHFTIIRKLIIARAPSAEDPHKPKIRVFYGFGETAVFDADIDVRWSTERLAKILASKDTLRPQGSFEFKYIWENGATPVIPSKDYVFASMPKGWREQCLRDCPHPDSHLPAPLTPRITPVSRKLPAAMVPW